MGCAPFCFPRSFMPVRSAKWSTQVGGMSMACAPGLWLLRYQSVVAKGVRKGEQKIKMLSCLSLLPAGSVSTAQIMVLNELRVLCVWLGCQIGLLSGKHAHVITSAPFVATNINVKHALHRKK